MTMAGLKPTIPKPKIWCLIHYATWSPLQKYGKMYYKSLF